MKPDRPVVVPELMLIPKKNIPLLLLTLLIPGLLILQSCGPSQEELRIGALEHFKRGNQLFTSNDPKGALSEYRMAIAMDDSQAVFYFNMGLAYYKLLLFNQAIDAYQAAIALNPKFGEAWYNLSLALDKTGETDRAFLAYERYQAVNKLQSRPEPSKKPDTPVVLEKPETPGGK